MLWSTSTHKEVWVTTPADKSIRIVDIKTMEQKEKLTYDGAPEDSPWTLCTGASIRI